MTLMQPMTSIRPTPPRLPKQERTLLLALGNDILGDDGVALAAADQLEGEVAKAGAAGEVDVIRSAEAGFALMEHLEGYGRALLLDSVENPQYPTGTVLSIDHTVFKTIDFPSPHYAGLPEVLSLARRLDMPMPQPIIILAMVVGDAHSIGEGLSPEVRRALPDFIARAKAQLLP